MAHPNATIILASQSPRRAELLRSAGYSFEVRAPDEAVEATANKRLPPRQLVIELAVLKARWVVAEIQSANSAIEYFPLEQPNQIPAAKSIVLAADTIAHCRNEILGKPESRADAGRMLRLMSGQLHEVLTGVCLWDLQTNLHREFCENTKLRMDCLSDEQIEMFLDSNEWQGKAGAFGYQDGLDWVHIENGLASNVVGLPVERLQAWLDELDNEN